MALLAAHSVSRLEKYLVGKRATCQRSIGGGERHETGRTKIATVRRQSTQSQTIKRPRSATSLNAAPHTIDTERKKKRHPNLNTERNRVGPQCNREANLREGNHGLKWRTNGCPIKAQNQGEV